MAERNTPRSTKTLLVNRLVNMCLTRRSCGPLSSATYPSALRHWMPGPPIFGCVCGDEPSKPTLNTLGAVSDRGADVHDKTRETTAVGNESKESNKQSSNGGGRVNRSAAAAIPRQLSSISRAVSSRYHTRKLAAAATVSIYVAAAAEQQAALILATFNVGAVYSSGATAGVAAGAAAAPVRQCAPPPWRAMLQARPVLDVGRSTHRPRRPHTAPPPWSPLLPQC